MSEAGGSGTINGVLYQLLGALEWGTATLRHPLASDDFTLILEPSGGGGDIRVERSGGQRVEQWKAKTGQGTWSLRTIISDVLPDLFLAVNPEDFESTVDFVFKTEGREGEWAEAKAFFASLAPTVPTEGAPLNIDEFELVRFFPEKDGLCTRRALFDKILEPIRKRKSVQGEPLNLSERKLYFLLRRFRLESTISVPELELQLEARISELIDDVGNAKAKRREACALLMELVSVGQVKIRPPDLLRRLRITGRAFRTTSAWRVARNALAARLDDQLGTEEYNPNLEVRAVSNVISIRPIAIVAGESGAGKTWRLASAARAATSAQCASIWTRATGDAAETFRRVAWEVWHYGLGHESQLAWDVVDERLQDAPVSEPEPLLTVFLDNVQSIEEAAQLVRFPWRRRRMRLVLATTTTIADSLAHMRPNDTEVLPLGDFTVLQLREYLRRRHQPWANVPASIRDTLHRPFLARLFCDLFGTAGWQAHNEFELYAAYWQRVVTAETQAEHPGDAVPLRRLARSVLEPESVYPWSATVLENAGLKDDIRQRLERVGWLRRIGSDAAEISHDRLLNWAAAEAVAEEWRTNAATIDTSIERLAQHASDAQDFRPKRRLGSAATDFLWIIFHERTAQNIGRLLPMLKRLEGRSSRSPMAADLYRTVLPATGPGIVPLLLSRLDGPEPSYEKPAIALVAAAIAQCINLYPEARTEILTPLSGKTARAKSDLFALVMTSVPQPDWLDTLWELHRENIELIQEEKSHEFFESYNRSLDALEATVGLNPGWLNAKLEERGLPPRQLGEAARLLCALPTAVGLPIWEKNRADLLSMLDRDERFFLAKCIGRFCDSTVKDKLLDWSICTESAIAQGECLATLCQIDPDAVITCLQEIGIKRFIFGHRAIGSLFAHRPGATLEALKEWMKAKPADCWNVADFFLRLHPELAEATIVRFLLEQWEPEVVRAAQADKAEPHPLTYYARILVRFRASEALQEYRRWANSNLDQTLGKFVVRLAGRPDGWFREDLELFFILLLRLGGEGLRIAVNGWLASDERLRHGWADLAVLIANDETRALLRRRAASLAVVDSSPRKLPWDQGEALVLLAALDENQTIIETVVRWGEQVVFVSLTDVREAQPAMTDADVAPAVAALAETEPIERRVNGAYALGLSGRPQDAVHLLPLIQATGPATELVIAALYGLDMLAVKEPSAIPHLRRWLTDEKSAPPAAKLLIRLGTDDALDALEQSVLKKEPAAAESFRWNVYRPLLRSPRQRDRLLRQMWSLRPKDSDPWQWMHNPLATLLPEFTDLGTADVEATIWQFAVPMEGPINNVEREAAAVQAIAKINPDEAYAMAEAKLLKGDGDSDNWMQLLIGIDPKRAIESLVNCALRGPPTLTVWKIGASLRTLQQSDRVRSLIISRLHSGPIDTRAMAAELAGWQGDDLLAAELKNIVSAPLEESVLETALRALRRLQRESTAQAVATKMSNLVGLDRWIAADAWCHMVEPLALSAGFCTDDYAATMRLIPPLYFERLQSEFRNRMQESKRKAERIDRERKRETE